MLFDVTKDRKILVVCFIQDKTLNISNILSIHLACSSNYYCLIQCTETVDTMDIKQFHEIHNRNNYC